MTPVETVARAMMGGSPALSWNASMAVELKSYPEKALTYREISSLEIPSVRTGSLCSTRVAPVIRAPIEMPTRISMGWPEYPTDCVTSAVDAMNPIGPAALLTIHTGSVPSTRLISRLLDVSGKSFAAVK
jgi:hypothetical protein